MRKRYISRKKPQPIALSSDKIAIRTCLMCGVAFKSGGPGNRICTACTDEREKIKVSQRDISPTVRTKVRPKGLPQ